MSQPSHARQRLAERRARLLSQLMEFSKISACKATNAKLASLLGCSERTIERGLAGLQKEGVIRCFALPSKKDQQTDNWYTKRFIFFINRRPDDELVLQLASLARTRGETTRLKVLDYCGQLQCTPGQLLHALKRARRKGLVTVLYGRSLDSHRVELHVTPSSSFDTVDLPYESKIPMRLQPAIYDATAEERVLRLIQGSYDGVCRATQGFIASNTGFSRISIRKAIHRLQQKGQVFVYKVGKTNLMAQRELPAEYLVPRPQRGASPNPLKRSRIPRSTHPKAKIDRKAIRTLLKQKWATGESRTFCPYRKPTYREITEAARAVMKPFGWRGQTTEWLSDRVASKLLHDMAAAYEGNRLAKEQGATRTAETEDEKQTMVHLRYAVSLILEQRHADAEQDAAKVGEAIRSIGLPALREALASASAGGRQGLSLRAYVAESLLSSRLVDDWSVLIEKYPTLKAEFDRGAANSLRCHAA